MEDLHMPVIGEKAPEFQARSTAGEVRFPADFEGKWVVLLSFPGAFHPICSSELAALAAMREELAGRGAVMLAFSPDSQESHQAWLKELSGGSADGAAMFSGLPVMADDGGVIASRYGISPRGAARPARGVFFIDPRAVIRAILLYPRGVGRSTAEIRRLLFALQALEAGGHTLPADWQPAPHPVVPKRDSAPQPAQAPQTAPIPQAASASGSASAPVPDKEAEEHPAAPQVPIYGKGGLRPVSQSVWEALAQAEPAPAKMPKVQVPLSGRNISAPVYPTIRSAAKAPAPASGRKTAGVRAKPSIAEQNRELFGALEAEAKPEIQKTETHEYRMRRDDPFRK